MTEIRSTPETIRAAMGWDFNSDTTAEALAAWDAYRELPANWDCGTPPSPLEQDAFTAGFDAAMLPRIEKPNVLLPTEVGSIITWLEDNAAGPGTRAFAHRLDSNEWRVNGFDLTADRSLEYDLRGKPFTLLRPVAEVAAEVLAEAHSAIEGSLAAPHSALAAIAAKWATK